LAPSSNLKGKQAMETTIKQLDRETMDNITYSLEGSLETWAEELGVAIELGRGTFRGNNARIQLKLSVLDSNGNSITEEVEAFKRHALHYCLSPDDLGREFIFQGKSFKICGLNRRSRKYPIIARSQDSKEYKFPLESVLEGLFQEKPCLPHESV
jgi:hypothetical protein